MSTLKRTVIALSGALMLTGTIAGAASAAEGTHHVRHLAGIHQVGAPHDACATMNRMPDGNWWSYNLACPHG